MTTASRISRLLPVRPDLVPREGGPGRAGGVKREPALTRDLCREPGKRSDGKAGPAHHPSLLPPERFGQWAGLGGRAAVASPSLNSACPETLALSHTQQ